MAKSIKIGHKRVGDNCPTFIIAEASSNHNGDLNMAKEMVLAAKDTGADCIKFQTFSADEFCADKESSFSYQSQGTTVVEKMYDMFKRFEFSDQEWLELKLFCDQNDILFLTTVQDTVNLDMLLKIGLEGIKVGSDDFDHTLNLERYAKTGLPIILSKGMADLSEVDRIINFLRNLTDRLLIMHCVSLYPVDPELMNIRQVQTLKYLYPEIIWGFSDHSKGTLASTIAVSLGAQLIEKHFTLDHDLPGPDHWFSMDPSEFSKLVKDIRITEKALGSGNIVPAPGEIDMKNIMRRRIIAKNDIPEGSIIDEQLICFKRAENGCFANQWDLIKNQKSAASIKQNSPISLSDINFCKTSKIKK